MATRSAAQIENQNNDFQLQELVQNMGMTMEDLVYLPELSPYLILDGHRTGNTMQQIDPTRGYVEGAIFSLRFARVFQELGGTKSTFLIHTLRNYSTMDRMTNIFDAIGDIGKKFIFTAKDAGIRLKYYGHEVHTNYALAGIINLAELATKDNTAFELSYLTNYSQEWGAENFEKLLDLPEINVIGRFTKGHYSGAGIPGHADKSNFVYIQQASISENWTDYEIIVLILTLLKSHLSLNGFVGGKSYSQAEREEIRHKREDLCTEDRITLSMTPRKRICTFDPVGPITVTF